MAKKQPFKTDAEKVFDIIGRGNESYCGDEILRHLNEAGFYVIKVDPNGDYIELIHTGYWKCQ